MTLHLNAPQIVLLTMMGLGLLLAAKDHGKPRDPNNFWIQLTSACITLGLLSWGGFFR